MSVKMECDNCHAQVSGEGMGNHGWIMLGQQLMFPTPGETPIQGTFCTVSCTVEWLQVQQASVSVVMQEERPAAEELRRTYEGEGTLKSFTGKAGEILRKVVGTDEPIAIFRARDLLSIFPLQSYAEVLEKYGAHYDQQASWGVVRDQFRAWQNEHTSHVRLPD